MEKSALIKPDYLFEVSWEVCNKVGGIHTVIATKAKTLQDEFGDQYILLGPDIWKGANNPEFQEDVTLFKTWKEHALLEGLKIRIGRWKISGNPIVILVDFTQFFTQKNEIFTNLWTRHKLDSLNGEWDYIEPALFGYATGKVIECFYRQHLNNDDKIIAQFHEWMTGVGILYLQENVPQAGTIFTTHATVVGRAIAGNGVPFYSLFDSLSADKAATDYHVTSKNSLEKVSAHTADCFTTVSDTTARECVKFLEKQPDVITQNGFDISILPDEQQFGKNRANARKKVLQVAEGLFNQKLAEDSLLIIKSGRYEYKNKGIDVLIDSLGELNKNQQLNKTVVAFIFVPASQTGPRKDLLERMSNPDFNAPKSGEVLTHYLQGSENDPILNEIVQVGLNNTVNDKVKIVFVPTYLDGNDGIFNLAYYSLLIGFDLTIFPSYYEPWGYTPLESIAYYIPSITTNLSGFGVAVTSQFGTNSPGISIINRTDFNQKEAASEISRFILEFTEKTEKGVQDARADAHKIALSFLWKNLIVYYKQAYDLALRKSQSREPLFYNKPRVERIGNTASVAESNPSWRSISVEAALPGELSAVKKITSNIWWSWDYEAIELFEYIDPVAWEKCDRNPTMLIRNLTFSRIEELRKDKTFLQLLSAVEKKFDDYMAKPKKVQPLIAYFSMEYGLCSFIKLYSGGLGILAGDYLKEASDEGTHIAAVGLLYKNGYFKQKISIHGDQLAEPESQDFKNLPLQLLVKKDNTPLKINLFFPGRTVAVQIWHLGVGRVSLYLLDTNLEQNSSEDRDITSYLYEGDQEMRLKQEFLLGIGGIRALTALNIKPDVCHCNEGHAAFINIERIYNLIKEDTLSFDQALEVVRASTLFTTHTSVPAANDMFTEEMLRKYIADKAHYFNIDWSRFIGLGRINAGDHDERFSMTYFAARMSQEINAVSKIHGDVSRKMLNPLWKNFEPGELHIGSVTNGVHYYTWTAKQWQQFCKSFLKPKKTETVTQESVWKKINAVLPGELWNIRQELKKELFRTVKVKLDRSAALQNNPKKILEIISELKENALVIGFARRFVAYKRSGLLFTDLERLARIVSNENRPVLFIFSGKAHPMDTQSQQLINKLFDASSNPALKNAIIFLENYDIDVARSLVQGVDIWLNTPERHTEASGTSGMKAAMNGVLNFSVLDGWWSEAYDGNNGWMLSENAVYTDHDVQNQLDAETIYNTLENEIISLYFDRNEEGVPVKWVDKIKASLQTIVPMFCTRRMITEYEERYYQKLYARIIHLKADNYALAKDIAAWKKKVASLWSEVDVISIEIPDNADFKSLLGDCVSVKVVLDLGKLSSAEVGIDVIISGDNLDSGCFVKEFAVTDQKGAEVTYECTIRMERTGTFEYAFRIFPRNENLPNRQDFDLVKWI